MGTSNSKYDGNVETYSLVWLDASVHTSPENLAYQEKLRASINQLDPFDNKEECLKYIQSLSPDNRIIFICSGKFGHIVVPQIHRLRQVSSIYVFCRNKRLNEQWAQNYDKASYIDGSSFERILFFSMILGLRCFY